MLDPLALGREQLDELGAAVGGWRVRRPPRGRGRTALLRSHSRAHSFGSPAPRGLRRTPGADSVAAREVGAAVAGSSRPTYRGRVLVCQVPRSPGTPAMDPTQQKSAATRTSRSLASGSATAARQPSPTKGRTLRPAASAHGGELQGPLAEGEPHEVALRLGHLPAHRRAGRPRRGRARRASASTRASSAGSWRSDSVGRRLGDPELTPNGRDTARRAAATGGRRDGVPDAQTGQPVGLGEGPGEHHVVVTPATVASPSTGSVHPHELQVRLVDHDEDPGRARPPRKAAELGRGRPPGRWGCWGCTRRPLGCGR